MAKPTKKELLEALKDPDLLKEAGLQPISDEEEKELFSDIVVGDDDNMSDLVRKINDKTRKQKAYLQKREKKILEAAEKKASEGESTRQQQEVDSFLKDHPELSANKELLDIVEPLYHNGKSLEDAWNVGCRSLGLDTTTGKAPSSEDDDKKKTDEDKGKKKAKSEDKKDDDKDKRKQTSFKSDTIDTGLPGSRSGDPADDDRPKTIREIAGELSNDLAAKGENPWRAS